MGKRSILEQLEREGFDFGRSEIEWISSFDVGAASSFACILTLAFMTPLNKQCENALRIFAALLPLLIGARIAIRPRGHPVTRTVGALAGWFSLSTLPAAFYLLVKGISKPAGIIFVSIGMFVACCLIIDRLVVRRQRRKRQHAQYAEQAQQKAPLENERGDEPAAVEGVESKEGTVNSGP